MIGLILIQLETVCVLNGKQNEYVAIACYSETHCTP